MKHLILLPLVFLAACGGGGSGAPNAGPTVVAPAPAAPACTPKRPVLVTLAGDSTQAGYDAWSPTGLVAEPPAMILQSILDAKYGQGSTVVRSIAVSGSTSASVALADFTGDVRVANWGINDGSYGVSIGDYEANLTALRPTILETPNPTDSPDRPGPQTQAYAEAMRQVAAVTGVPVADVMAFELTRDWHADLDPDFVHPTQAGYVAIVTDVLAPVVEAQVAVLLCQ